MDRTPTPVDSPPSDLAQSPPRDLHPTTDIRFVMVELAKLSTLVDRLITDVGAQEDKLDALRHQATYIKGGMAVAVVALGLFGWFITQMVEGKLQAVLNALSAIE